VLYTWSGRLYDEANRPKAERGGGSRFPIPGQANNSLAGWSQVGWKTEEGRIPVIREGNALGKPMTPRPLTYNSFGIGSILQTGDLQGSPSLL